MEYVKLNGQFPNLGRSAVTLGKFDGIHRGHRKLIRTPTTWILSLAPAAFTARAAPTDEYSFIPATILRFGYFSISSCVSLRDFSYWESQ